MTRVKLTLTAAARFPDIGARLGTVLDRAAGTEGGWLRVAWTHRKGATPDDDVFTTVWLPREDLEDAP
jgi:hypothetical protein